MDFLHALNSVFSIMAVGLVGFLLARLGLIPAEVRRFLPWFVTCVVLPPYLFHSITTTFERDSFGHLLLGAIIPFVSILLTFFTAWLIGRLFHVKHGRFGLFCCSFSTSSAIFVGIPVCDALFGSSGIPYALLYYIANATFFWTIGNFLIANDAEQGRAKRISVRRILHNIFSPPFIGFSCGLVCSVLLVRPPDWFMNSARIVGQMTTPLALIFIGISLAQLHLSQLKVSKDLLLAILGRLLICPLLTAGVVHILHVRGIMGSVFILQASLPAVMQASILSAHYRTDPEFGTLVICSTTLLSIVSIPLLMSIV